MVRRSAGGFQIQSETLIFSGATNTDGGGFSSIRTDVQALDLSARLGIRLRLRGDGRTYRLRLETAAGIAYFASAPVVCGWRVLGRCGPGRVRDNRGPPKAR